MAALPTYSPPTSQIPAAPNSQTIYSLLGNAAPTGSQSLTNTALPAASNYLGPNSPYLQAAMATVQGQGNANNSAIPGYLAKMNMGSVNGGNIGSALQSGNNNMTSMISNNMQGQALMQLSNQLAKQAMMSMGFDIKNNQTMLNDLAQAIGQQLAQGQQLSEFNSAQSQAQKLAHQGMNYGLASSLIGGGIKGMGMAMMRGSPVPQGGAEAQTSAETPDYSSLLNMNMAGIPGGPGQTIPYNMPISAPTVNPYAGMLNLSGNAGGVY